jgi:hypothetical protein
VFSFSPQAALPQTFQPAHPNFVRQVLVNHNQLIREDMLLRNEVIVEGGLETVPHDRLWVMQNPVTHQPAFQTEVELLVPPRM